MKIVFVLAVLFNTASFAQTYYVSPSGNDSNDGLTIGTSFLTLQHASDVVQAGDTVQVMPGTYVGFYHTTSGTATNRILFSAQANVLINQPNGITDDGINLEGASYVIVEGFNVYGVPRAGIRSVTNDHVIIRYNSCDSCGVWGILTGFSEDILIENNICTRSIDEHGIYFSNSADNPVIRKNICWGNNACGIHMNGDESLGGGGIISNALMEYNVIIENGYGGGSGINCDGVQDSRIQNNLLYYNHASGISLYRIDGGGGASNNVVINNTIDQAADARWALNISDGSTGNIVFNNILCNEYSSFRGSISIDSSSMQGFKSNYNVLVDRMSNDGNDSNMPLSQWQQIMGLDSNSIISSPDLLFITFSGADYHLLINSPAQDMGRMSYHSISAPIIDLDNETRPQGIYHDAGVYETSQTSVISQLSKTIITWQNISAKEFVSVFDLSGRMIYEGTKKDFETIRQRLGGMYFFRTHEKFGWIQALR